MRLSDCKTKTEAVILEILESKFDNKLLEYGIVPGAKLSVISKAPFNGPIYIAIESQRIAIRKKEATHIIVE